MSEFKKLFFIINKFSGAGFRPKLEGKILDACHGHNTECTIEFTSGRGHATQLAARAIGQYDAVIAVGGDGTVNETAQGLVNSETPLGILPKGSGNGLARHLGVPMQLEPALAALFTSRVVRIDTFLLNNKLSINVSGIGFDGHVANLFGNQQKRGFWGYTKLILKEFINYPVFDADMIQNGNTRKMKDNFIIAIANSSQYGNNARISPLSSVTDHQLNVARVSKIPLHRSFHFAYRLFTRKLHNNESYTSLPVENITLTTRQPAAYHIDGEPCGSDTRFEIIIKPNSLPLLVPKNSVTRI